MRPEIELKLAVPPRNLPALRRHPLVAAAPQAERTVTLLNNYFDTPELALGRQRVALRTRKQGRRWLQTVKTEGHCNGGLSTRPEWEAPYAGAWDFTVVDAESVRHLLETATPRLTTVFSTNFRRETRRIQPRPGVSILLMIDRGTIVANGREIPLSEVELELEHGTAVDLFELAIMLAEELPVRPEDASKAERGMRLYLGEAAKPMRAPPSRIRASDSPLEAFRRIAHDGLRQWQANAAQLNDSDDPEFVHQMRVALRRTRSALKLFASALPSEFVARWNHALRDTAAALGEARDIDVLYEELLGPVLADRPADAGVARLAELVSHQREAARRRVRAHLKNDRQGARLIRFAADLQQLQSSALDASADLATFVALRMDHLRKRCRRRWHDAHGGDQAALHALRIAMKQLRYGIEFFAPLFPPKAFKRYQRRFSDAQDCLGYLNDTRMGHARLADWAGQDAELQLAVAYVDGWHAGRSKGARDTILSRIKPLLWGKCLWK